MNSIIDIIPALIAFTITGVILVYFLKMNSSLGIIISSFVFIVSGFIFESIYKNYDWIRSFALENNQVLNIPIITTIIGIFMGNSLLNFFKNNEEKKKVATIFINYIDSQVRSLQIIDDYLTDDMNKLHNYSKYIKIYRNRQTIIQFYQDLFSKIGVFDIEISDIISKYFMKLEEYISYLDKYLLDFEEDEYDKIRIRYSFARLNNIITILFGCLSIYILKVKYIEIDKIKVTDEFIDIYKMQLSNLKSFYNEDISQLIELNLANYFITLLREIIDNLKKVNKTLFKNKLVVINLEEYFIIKFFRHESLVNVRLATSKEELNKLVQEEKERWNNIQEPEIITLSLN